MIGSLAWEPPYAVAAALKKTKRPKKKKKLNYRSFHARSAEMNLTSIHEDAVSIPGLAQWVKDLALL